ncbi:MAG: tyrosine-type recombinase/integrase [Bacilli bacterium]
MTKLLKEYTENIKIIGSHFLFSDHGSNNPTPLSEHSIRMAIRKYSKIAVVKDINTHGIRHSNTTWLLTGDFSLEDIGKVSERLGHSSKTTTLNTYFHINR